MIAAARGAFGASADYLERTRVALVSHGIVDPYLERIAERLVGSGAVSIQPAPGVQPGG